MAGLIHLSELAWTHVSHPSEILKRDDVIDVYILNIEHEQQRVALSLKRLQPEPWSQVFDYYQINQLVDAVITKLTNFGAFARIDNRIEGLIHISEITDKNITHPKEVVSENQEVKVRIIHIDPERKRMGLSLKQVEGQQNWEEYQAQSPEEETPSDIEHDESEEEVPPDVEHGESEEEAPSDVEHDESEEEAPPDVESDESGEEAPSDVESDENEEEQV